MNGGTPCHRIACAPSQAAPRSSTQRRHVVQLPTRAARPQPDRPLRPPCDVVPGHRRHAAVGVEAHRGVHRVGRAWGWVRLGTAQRATFLPRAPPLPSVWNRCRHVTTRRSSAYTASSGNGPSVSFWRNSLDRTVGSTKGGVARIRRGGTRCPSRVGESAAFSPSSRVTTVTSALACKYSSSFKVNKRCRHLTFQC